MSVGKSARVAFAPGSPAFVGAVVTAQVLTQIGAFTLPALLPGYFVRVRVPFSQEKDSLLVPDTALGSDQGGRYLLVANKDNVVEQRKVQIGPVDGGLRVIESGLKPDDRVITSGLLRVIPGQKIDPQQSKIEQPQASSK